MAKHRAGFFLVFLCCTPLFLGSFTSASSFPGSHYSTTNPTVSISDNTSGCVVGKSQCWKQFNSGFGISAGAPGQMAVTVDGIAFAVGVDQKLYKYVNGAWQLNSSAPTGVAGIAVVSTTSIYANTQPNGLLYHYNGTSWTSLGMDAVLLSAGSDGTVYIETPSFELEKLSSGTWKQVAYPSGHGYVKVVSAASTYNVWLIMQDNTLLSLNPSSGTFVVVAPPSGTTAPALVATAGFAGGLNETWLMTANNGTVANNVFLYNSSTGGWTAMIGLLDNIATGGHMFTVGARNSNSLIAAYHFNALKFSLSSSTSGYFDCTQFNCPSGATHTGTTTINFFSGGHTGTNSNSGPIQPGSRTTGIVNTSVVADTEDCDPIFGDPNGLECQGQVSGDVICSAMGTIVSTVISSCLSGGSSGGPAPPVALNPVPTGGNSKQARLATMCISSRTIPGAALRHLRDKRGYLTVEEQLK